VLQRLRETEFSDGNDATETQRPLRTRRQGTKQVKARSR
jgi:hypothetical protein